MLTLHHGLGPGSLAILMEDDRLLSVHLQRFLADHRVPYCLPLYDDQGRYVFAAPAKIKVLANALLRSVAVGHDNELFILAADLLELEDDLAPLLRAVGVALARQHQVMLVLPLPRGVSLEDSPVDLGSSKREERQAALRLITQERLQRSYRKVAKAFSRKGVTVVRAEGEQSVRLILARMEQIRLAGRTR